MTAPALPACPRHGEQFMKRGGGLAWCEECAWEAPAPPGYPPSVWECDACGHPSLTEAALRIHKARASRGKCPRCNGPMPHARGVTVCDRCANLSASAPASPTPSWTPPSRRCSVMVTVAVGRFERCAQPAPFATPYGDPVCADHRRDGDRDG